MSKDKIVYIPTPISEKPKETGRYFVYWPMNNVTNQIVGDEYYFDGNNWYISQSKIGGIAEVSIWLKPMSLEELLKDAFQAGVKSGVYNNNRMDFDDFVLDKKAVEIDFENFINENKDKL